jgi:hypothetical protein
MILLCSLRGCRILRVVRDGRNALLASAEVRRDHARCPERKTVSTSADRA